MKCNDRLTEASKDLNKKIYEVTKTYKLNNAETLGLLTAISITLVQLTFTLPTKERKRKQPKS